MAGIPSSKKENSSMGISVFPEDEVFISNFETELEKADDLKHLTPFYYPWQISLARFCLKKLSRNVDEWGGFENAFRKRLVSASRKIKHSMFDISLVEIVPNSMMIIQNRKILLERIQKKGVSQENLGDILPLQDRFYLAIDRKYGDFAIDDAMLKTDIKLPADLIPKRQNPVSSTVASVRLDSICSIAFKSSRGKLKGLIENGGAMVDYSFVYKGGKEIQEGNVISLRGFPRIRLLEASDMTKRGRHKVRVEFLD